MSRRLIFVPLVALIAAVAGIGLLLGARAVSTTETEAIDRMAELYLDEAGEGARRTDCAARPATSDDLWLVVACGDYEYFVDPYGRLAHSNRPDPAS